MAAWRALARPLNSATQGASVSSAQPWAIAVSRPYIKALRSTGTIEVVWMVFRLSPSAIQRELKSHPLSAPERRSRNTSAAGRLVTSRAVSTSSR